MLNKRRQILAVLAVLFAALACSSPAAQPTPLLFPTPDFTLTAIFSVLYITPTQPTPIPPSETATAIPVVPTETSTTELFLTPNAATLAPTLTSVALTAQAPATRTMTPAPTNTSVPNSRAVANVVARYFDHAPAIDGRLSEWGGDSIQIPYLVFGNNKWDNGEDLSGAFVIGWDEKNLYVGATVTDEDYVQNASGEDLYLGDSIEILLDTNLAADFYGSSLSEDDFQLGISPGREEPGDSPEAYLWFPRSLDGGRGEVQIAGRRVEDGYVVEAAIPWSVFGITPQAGVHYGFAFSISDNDLTGKIAQQTMLSNVPVRRLTDPTSWGDLLLTRP